MLRTNLRLKVLDALKADPFFADWGARQDIRTQQSAATYRVTVGDDAPWEDGEENLDLDTTDGFLATEVQVAIVHDQLDPLDNAIETAREAVLARTEDLVYGECEIASYENTMLRAVLTFESIDRATIQS